MNIFSNLRSFNLLKLKWLRTLGEKRDTLGKNWNTKITLRKITELNLDFVQKCTFKKAKCATQWWYTPLFSEAGRFLCVQGQPATKWVPGQPGYYLFRHLKHKNCNPGFHRAVFLSRPIVNKRLKSFQVSAYAEPHLQRSSAMHSLCGHICQSVSCYIPAWKPGLLLLHSLPCILIYLQVHFHPKTIWRTIKNHSRALQSSAFPLYDTNPMPVSVCVAECWLSVSLCEYLCVWVSLQNLKLLR